MANLFNTTSENPLPRYTTDQLDLEPDEYYYDFGGYSGKFYFKPDGEIILVPFQDFIITQERRDADILEFTFTTPEGIKYTFNKLATSQHTNYTLPIFLKYPERGGGSGVVEFEYPKIAKTEYPVYDWVQGTPYLKEVKKDYLTNYHIENGPNYTSAWHATSVESKISKEKIDVLYKQSNNDIHYNSSKNWSHTFPNFKRTDNSFNSYFKTKGNDDINILDFPTEWKNGFADLTYSITETKVSEPYLESISNNRGKVATYTYGQANASMPGADLCTKIEVEKNGTFCKGWEFNYTTPEYIQVNPTCVDTFTTVEKGQSAAYADESEYYLKITDADKDPNSKFFFYFPLSIKVICVNFQVPIKLKAGIDDDESGYYHNVIQEWGSLMHLKDMLNILDEKEEQRYQAEFVRNFLFSVTEINEGDQILSFNYTGDLSSLPKRNSIHQDIWGYYNGISSTMIPFIRESYIDIIDEGLTSRNSQHFAFTNDEGTFFPEGRKWEANFNFAEIGQLESIYTETGGFIKYYYDLHEYPTGEGIFSDTVSGGIRIQSIEKGSNNGSTQTTSYKYYNPTVVNFPLFSDQHPLDRYYKNLEQRVRTSWMPLNEWQSNKGGYVGYGEVHEEFSNNGRVEHFFTTPEDYVPDQPDTKNLYVKYRRPLNFEACVAPHIPYETFTDTPLDYRSTVAPLIDRGWKFGLEKQTKIRDNNGKLLQKTNTDYAFIPMLTNSKYPQIHYPKSVMSQYLHYGSVNDIALEGNIFNIVNTVKACPDNLVAQLVRYVLRAGYTEVPYRYIEKDISYSKMIIESEKVEVTTSRTINYYTDGDNSSITTYDYVDDSERKVNAVIQDFYAGGDSSTTLLNSTSTVYKYPDNISSGQYPFLDAGLLSELDLDHNFERPIHQVNLLDGVITSGSLTGLTKIDDRFLTKTTWGYRNGKLVLVGKFDSYQDSPDPQYPSYAPAYLPTSYTLAQHGEGTTPSAYNTFPPITMTWNGNLQMLTRTFEGYTSTNVYNNLMQLESTTDVNALTTSYTYDNRRRLDIVTAPGGLQTIDHDYVMNPLTITKTTTFSDQTPEQTQVQKMDGWGNPTSVERQGGVVLSSTTYDNMFRPKTQCQIGSGCNTITYEPSPLGRVASVTDAVENVTSTKYLGPTSLFPYAFTGVQTTDPNGHVTLNYVDAFEKVVGFESGMGGRTTTEYDEFGRVEYITNPIEEKYTYSYNSMGLLATKKIPNKGTEKYWYDRSMRMVAKIDSNNNNIILGYDDLYRLITIGKTSTNNFGDVATTVREIDDVNSFIQDTLLSNTYNPTKTWIDATTEGILRQGGVNGQKTTTNIHDPYGRIINSTINYGSDIGTIIQATDYTDANQIDWTTSEVNGTTIKYDYVYDSALRLDETLWTHNGAIDQLIEKLGYDEEDRVKEKIIGGGLQKVDYTY
ncbi:MAG: hypothetical protein AAF573_16280, partial [Bacteroidota bacterium]